MLDQRNRIEQAAELLRPVGPEMAHYAAILRVLPGSWARYVEPAIESLIASGTDIRALTAALRVLSGVYEQAARAAAYEKGDVD